MVTGHLGIAFAVRSVRRDVPLAPLLGAALLPDIVDGAYWLANFCSPMGLYSHSLPAVAILATVSFAIAFAAARGAGIGGSQSAGIAGAIAAVVLLHLPADLITGFKLMWPNGPVWGLELYDHPILDFLVEVPVMIAGWWLLRRDSTASRAPRWATAGITLGFLILTQASFDALAMTSNKSVKPSGCVAGQRVRPNGR